MCAWATDIEQGAKQTSAVYLGELYAQASLKKASENLQAPSHNLECLFAYLLAINEMKHLKQLKSGEYQGKSCGSLDRSSLDARCHRQRFCKAFVRQPARKVKVALPASKSPRWLSALPYLQA